MGHNHKQCNLPQVSALPCHIGAGEQNDLLIVVEENVIRYKMAGYCLNHRVAPLLDAQRVIIGHSRPDKIMFNRCRRQALKHIQAGNNPGVGLHRIHMVMDFFPDFHEKLIFQLFDPLIRP